jgi:uncharacterized protein
MQRNLVMLGQHPCETVIGSILPWLGTVIHKCHSSGISKEFLSTKEIDHICFRCSSNEEYIDITSRITSEHIGILLVEGIIGGRPISTVLLSKPYIYENWSIPCIEITSPKAGKVHQSGLEHIEVVIGDKEDGFLHSKEKLLKFTEQYPLIEFDLKAIDKEVNADVSLALEGVGSIKFHVKSLRDVCNYELSGGLVEKVAPDYFVAPNLDVPN